MGQEEKLNQSSLNLVKWYQRIKKKLWQPCWKYFLAQSNKNFSFLVESFYISEFPEIARARIERLITNGDENNAFRLCNNYITSKEHVFRDYKTTTESSLDDELIPIFVFFVQLLNKQNDLKAIVDRVGIILLNVYFSDMVSEYFIVFFIFCRLFVCHVTKVVD